MDVVEVECKPVITRAYLALQKEGKEKFLNVQAFKACSIPKTLNERQTKPHTASKNALKDDEEFDIKKVRGEVLNFAMSNQRVTKNKKKMHIFQAIKLGAKPLPKPYKNYKELQAERKRLKEIREQRRKTNQLGKSQASLATIKYRKGRGKSEKRAPYTGIDKHYGMVQLNQKKK